MNLREKLNKLDKENYGKPNQNDDRKNICNKKLIDLISGKIITRENGQYFHRKIKFKSDYKHGLYQLKDITGFKQKDINNLSGKNKGNVTVNFNNMLFIDTETTGLMGGTGTVAFLVGVGYFNDDNFIVEQYFMRDFDEETAMLNNLINNLQKTVLLSFNGKCFDLPLLKTRLILNKLPAIKYDLHLDLLHLSRRIWSYLESCCLNNLEENILQFERENDILGSEIPHIYFDYLENKDPVNLPPVFKHNMLDIISLVTLTTHLLKVHNSPHRLQLSAAELFNLGKLLQKRKKLADSINILKKARKKANSSILKRKIDIKLSWQYKRANKWSKAVTIWKDMLSRQSGGLFPYRELAKYYEHREKNYKKAKTYSKNGLLYLKHNRPLIENSKEEKDKLEYRLNRLERKIIS